MKNVFIMLLFFLSIQITAQVINYNTRFEISTQSGYSSVDPAICNLTDGRFVVVWIEQDNVYGQTYNLDFSKAGDTFKINDNSGYLVTVSISASQDGGFVVVWGSTAGHRWNTEVQVFNSDLTRRGNVFLTDNYTVGYQRHPAVCSLPDGKFVIVSDSSDGGNSNIRGHVFNSDNSSLGEEFRINTASNSQFVPSICTLADGRFVVVWESRGQDGSEYGVYGQAFNSDISRLGNEFRINSQTVGSQGAASVANLANGGVVVVWKGSQQDGSLWGVFGQVFNSDLSPTGGEFQVNTYIENSQTNPSVYGLSDDGFVVVWESYEQNGFSSAIYGQVYNSDATPRGRELLISSINIDGEQIQPFVCSLHNGKFIIVWKTRRGLLGKYYLNEPINHELINFNLFAPEMDEIITELNPKLEWENPTDIHLNFQWEIEYDLYLSETIEFENPLIIKGITKHEYRVNPLDANKTYFWKVLAKNYYGDSLWSSNVNGFFIDPDATVGINENKLDLPKGFSLSQNYPNPFNPSTIIKYTIPFVVLGHAPTVQLKVYDILGKEVATLVNKEQPAGSYEVEFKAEGLSSGIYFYKLQTSGFIESGKMVLNK